MATNAKDGKHGQGGKNLELSELANYGEYTDVKRRLWHIKVFTLRDYSKFQDSLLVLFAELSKYEGDKKMYDYGFVRMMAIYQQFLSSPKPTITTYIRRLLKKPDFTLGELIKLIPTKDLYGMMDRAIFLNRDQTLDEYMDMMAEFAKKKEMKVEELLKTKQAGAASCGTSSTSDGNPAT